MLYLFCPFEYCTPNFVAMDNQNGDFRGTWTAYPSLLNELGSEAHQNALENAACAHYCGRYDEAEIIFEHQLPKSDTKLILTLQRADMYRSQSLEQRRARLLQSFLGVIEKDKSTEESVKLLIRLMLADSELWTHGRLNGVVECISRVRAYLRPRGIENLSDVDASGRHRSRFKS